MTRQEQNSKYYHKSKQITISDMELIHLQEIAERYKILTGLFFSNVDVLRFFFYQNRKPDASLLDKDYQDRLALNPETKRHRITMLSEEIEFLREQMKKSNFPKIETRNNGFFSAICLALEKTIDNDKEDLLKFSENKPSLKL